MRHYPLRKIVLFSIIFSFSYVNAIAQNIDYESNITQFAWSETTCNSEAGVNEHTFKGYITDFVNGENYSGCIQADEDGNGVLSNSWASTNAFNVAVSQLRLRMIAFEDDGGDRCTFETGDDCLQQTSGTYDLTNPNENGSYNSYTSRTVSSGPYNVSFRYRYKYNTTNLNSAVENALAISTGGNQPFWGSRGSWASTDSDCATSGRITDNQTSSFSSTVSCKNSVTFKWNVSSEANYDYLRFMIDGVEQAKISGTPGWATVTYALDPTKEQTLTWEYTKDGSVSNGLDRGFVDAISFQNTSYPVAGTGSNVWNVRAYQGSSYNTYKGYYVDNNLNIDTKDFYDVLSSPSEVSGYVGCFVPMDYHSIQYDRMGFPCGLYQIDIAQHDDDIEVFIDGQSVFSHVGANDAHTNVWTGVLDANSRVLIRTKEFTGNSETVVNFTVFTELSGGVVSANQNICPSAVPDGFITVTPSTGSGSLTYQWQQSTNNVNWTNIGGATSENYNSEALSSTTYFRKITNDECGNSLYSNVLTITVEDLVDPETPTLETVAGECSVTVEAPTTTDNCAGTIAGATSDPLSFTEVGNYTIEWTFDDGNGNSITVPQSVAVFDVTDPETPTLQNVIAECSVTVDAPTTTDNCEGTLTATTDDPVTYSETGSYSISWVFDDTNGNSITVPQTVIIYDVTSPETPTLADVNGDYSVTVSAPTTTDACVGEITGTTSDPLTYETAGQYIINWNFDDGNGNSTTAEQTVNVLLDEVVWNGTSWSNVDGPTEADDVVIDGNLTDLTGFTCNNLTINTGYQLTIAGSTWDVKGDLTCAGQLILQSGASLLTYEGNSVTGDIQVRRNTRYADGRYSFVGTPVINNVQMTTSDLGEHVYTYDEAQSADANDLARWLSAAGTELLIPGKGYTQANQQLIEFMGVPNTGTITYNGSYANDGWHLVSNPYPAAIEINAFLDENTNTTDAVYIWDDNNSATGRGSNSDYIVANRSGALEDLSGPDSDGRWNGHIGSAQGFFVKLDGSEGNITFTEGMRRANKNADDNFFRKDERKRPIVRLYLKSQDGLHKQAMLAWNDKVFDDRITEGYDAEVFNTRADYAIYTEKANKRLVIQTVTSAKTEIPLGINVEKEGIYQIEIRNENDYQGTLYLYDAVTDNRYDFTQGAYSFSTGSGNLTDRFTLLTIPSVLARSDLDQRIYTVGKTLYIYNIDNQTKSYQLYNLSGKLILKAQVNGRTQLDLNKLPSAIYLISDGVASKKIILK